MGPEFWGVLLLLLLSGLWAPGCGLWFALGSGLGSGLWALVLAGLRSFGGFWGVLGGFCFCFCSLIFGFGGRLKGSAIASAFWLDWAGLGWAAAGLSLGCFRAIEIV